MSGVDRKLLADLEERIRKEEAANAKVAMLGELAEYVGENVHRLTHEERIYWKNFLNECALVITEVLEQRGRGPVH